MSSAARLLLVAALAAGAVACNKVQARTPPPAPPLDPPPAPSRLVIPSVLPEPAPPGPEAPPPVELAQPPVQLNDPPARSTRGATPPPPPPAAQTQDPQVLRTAANVVELERDTRQRLSNAERDLGAVRRAELGADGRTHYDSVQNFIRASGEALKVKNYVLAYQLADKAARLAGLLVRGGRPSVP